MSDPRLPRNRRAAACAVALRATIATTAGIALLAAALTVGCGGLPPTDDLQPEGAVVVMVVEEATNAPVPVPVTVIVGGVRGTLEPSDEQLVLRDVPLGTGTPPTQPLTATAEGYVTATQQVQLNVTTATWVTVALVEADLSTTGTVSGTVSDGQSGEPIRNAFVQFTPPAAAQPLVAGYTDAEGAFVIGGIPEGPRDLTVQASGYLALQDSVTVTSDADGANPPLELTLVPGDTTVRVTGTVVNVLTREPIAGAEVTIGDRPTQLTGADGRFEFTDVSVGEQEVEVTAAGFEPLTTTITIIPGMGDITLELFEEAHEPPGRPYTLAGTITLNGPPDNSGATVTAFDLDAAIAVDQVVTGPSGRYELFVPPGRYEVRVAVGDRELSREVTVPPGGVVVDGIDFVITVQ